MLTHRATDPLPARTFRDNKPCVRDMRGAAGLIRMQSISANYLSILSGHEHVRVVLKPIRQRIVARDIWIERICFARGDYLPENFPDRIAIGIVRGPDF